MKYDYDVVVLGGGAAGLVAATGAVTLGAKTALIENNKLGGDCTWYGCIPSKALLKSSQVFSLLKRLKEFGISSYGDVRYDSGKVMVHVRNIIKKISSHHPASVFEKRGIKVLFANLRFIDNRTIELDKSKHIRAKRFIICTGSRPLIPHIEGLNTIDYLTNENIFDLDILPKSISVLGGGPIGIELAQSLAKLGVEVSIVEMLNRLLIREDEEAADALVKKLINEGVKIYTGKKAVKVSKDTDSIAITLENSWGGHKQIIRPQKVLVAVGRVPNLEGLNLEKAGVKYTNKGIIVNKHLRTTAKNIYAAGDAVGPYQFSHMAEYQAITALGNALFPFKKKVDYNAVGWCTFTEPELAHLGLTEEEARSKYKKIKVYRSKYKENDRAVTDLEEEGFAKVICNKKGSILGAHIVGAGAGEIIHEYVLAKSKKLKISDLSSTIHIYPTLAQIVKRSADQYYMEILNCKCLKAFIKFFIKILK